MRKLNGNARIVSKDAQGNSIEVTIKFQSENNLEKAEVSRVVLQMARNVADGIRTLPYSGFGPENTTIEM